MITNKDIRVENGNLVLNGDKFPLDGQSPAAIMQIVKDNSDTTPTEDSTAPITSGGVFTALAGIAGQIGNLNFAVLEQGFENVATTTAWGDLYLSAKLSFNLSSLGLQQPPKAVILSIKDMSQGILIRQENYSSSIAYFSIIRPLSSTGISAAINALVIY